MAWSRVLRWAAAAAVLATAVWITATELIEAYGAGPPFYGRTTNMDKWSSPWLLLSVIDGVALLLIWAMVLRGQDTAGRR